MTIKVFSIFDSKSLVYNTPMFFRAKGEAIRQFSMMANDKSNADNLIAACPEDFVLFELGDFDPQRGVLIPHKSSVPLGKAIEFIRSHDSRRDNAINNESHVQ